MTQLPSRCLLFVWLCVLAWPLNSLPAQPKTTGQPQYKLAYATYLGGSEFEQAREIILYPGGSALIGGQTNSSNFPATPGVVQASYAGDDPNLGHGGIYGGDCFLARLSSDGRRILFATYVGGSKQERNVYGMALDRRGNIVITSATRSPDLPTTAGCFQPRYGGPPSDWFVAKLSPDCGRLLWCTYVGGSDDDFPRGGLAIDGQDNVYVVGGTASPDFPTTPGVFQRNRRGTRDAAIVKLKPDGSGLVFSTLFGGNHWDGTMGVRVDASGDVYVAGHTQSSDFPVSKDVAQPDLSGQSDCYLAKLSSDASRLLYSTYLGGSANEFAEHRPWLAPEGTALLTGYAGSPDFPTTEGAFQRALKGTGDGFLTKLSADGKNFAFSTFLGGSGGEFWLMPTVDAEGNIFIVGQTDSRDFPVTPDALQPEYGGGQNDGALAVLSPDGARLVYATYLGGSGDEIVRSVTLGPYGEVYLVGSTSSTDFPVTASVAQTAPGGKADAFVVKLIPSIGYDMDADGIPDGWEKQHFGSAETCAPDADPDFDGLTNLREYNAGTQPDQPDTDGDEKTDGSEVFAGTDPLDPKSLFQIVAVTWGQSGAAIEWSVVPEMRYQIHLSSDLQAWSSSGKALLASAQHTSLSIADLASQHLVRRFYRVEVLP